MTAKFENIIDLSGIQSLKSLVDYIDFLENEKRRAYNDYVASEMECERLRQENERLRLSFGRYNTRQLHLQEHIEKARRKYLAR